MTTEISRLVGRLLWLGFEGTTLPDPLRQRITKGEVGGVTLFARNIAQAERGADISALIALNQAIFDAGARADGILISVDQEGGGVQRLRAPATEWPAMGHFSDRGNAELARAIGDAMGSELAACGFHIDFAPVLDVRTREHSFIGIRAFARTADKVAELALAFAQGLESAGVAGCGKHFPGHGDTVADSHLELPRLELDEQRLRNIELEPFARATQSHLPMIMTAHIIASHLDAVPATLSRKVLGDILRDDLGYRGVVVSDDLDMAAIAANYDIGEAAVAAIEAGCDVLLLCRNPEHQRVAHAALVDKAKADSRFRDRLRQSAARVSALTRKYGSRGPQPLDTALSILGCQRHRELAEQLRPTPPQ